MSEETFGQALRRLRGQASVRGLARRANCSKSHIWDLEQGNRQPTPGVARALDAALNAGGALISLAEPTGKPDTGMLSLRPPAPTLTPDDDQRLAPPRRPNRVDPVVVESLAGALAALRRLDDALGPAAVLATARPQAHLATQLLRESSGPARDLLAPVAAQWVQFTGWLHAEAGIDHAAMRLLTNAEEMADDIGDGVLTAQALDRKAYVARHRSRPLVAVRHYLAAYHTAGAHPAQRAKFAAMCAYSYTIAGERANARRLLSEAEGLTNRASDPPEATYWLTPDYQHLGIGLALAGLGERAAAAEHLTAGLDTLPPGLRHGTWLMEYRAALKRAQGG
jgi:transcriptional regulator with XRE-family HTH domain